MCISYFLPRENSPLYSNSSPGNVYSGGRLLAFGECTLRILPLLYRNKLIQFIGNPHKIGAREDTGEPSNRPWTPYSITSLALHFVMEGWYQIRLQHVIIVFALGLDTPLTASSSCIGMKILPPSPCSAWFHHPVIRGNCCEYCSNREILVSPSLFHNSSITGYWGDNYCEH